ncbi:hypothetical protein [Vibrio phage VP4B]|uniref:Uncharacterized protein n=1 Tax=Vibrio phage VP4B TaxID=1262540 RepID=V9LZB9_9CAUD|nr:hypothetical protein FDJ61_gp060 [Vibrio phage VP4B]AGB07174.1 hypothetical protein [Vibrio phage VP4B]
MRLQERLTYTLALRALAQAWVEQAGLLAQKTERQLDENIFVGVTEIPWNGETLMVKIVDRRAQSYTIHTEGFRHIGLPNIRIELPLGDKVSNSPNEDLQTILNEVDILSRNTLTHLVLETTWSIKGTSTVSNYGTTYLAYEGDGYPMELKHKDGSLVYELAPNVLAQRKACAKWLFNESLNELPMIIERLLEEQGGSEVDILNIHIFEENIHRIILKRYGSEVRLVVILDHPSNYFEMPLLRVYEYRKAQIKELIRQLRNQEIVSPGEVELIHEMVKRMEFDKNELGVFHYVDEKALVSVKESAMPFHNSRRFEI